MTSISHQRFLDWIDRYESAWRTAGIEPLHELFAADAGYRAAPFAEPMHGLEQIGAFWETEREGPDEAFTLQAWIVAAELTTAVARVEVTYGDPLSRVYRDLWVITLDEGELCTAFEEWPFFPEQSRVAAQ